jgi:hypothetical protein
MQKIGFENNFEKYHQPVAPKTATYCLTLFESG